MGLDTKGLWRWLKMHYICILSKASSETESKNPIQEQTCDLPNTPTTPCEC